MAKRFKTEINPNQNNKNQTFHSKKFDRQIRLWGIHGQQNIEKTNIVVLGSGPTASETLKNLVLPNIGKFTIIDDQKVMLSDLDNNFFVTSDDIGKYRAEIVTKYLLELNPEVEGNFLIKDPKYIIDQDIMFFNQFTLVIATQILGDFIQKLSSFCYDSNIPFIWIRSYGLLACLRVAFKEHLIIESHPETDTFDPYIHYLQLKRFPKLLNYLKTFDLSLNDTFYNQHIPFIAILVKCCELYMNQHNGSLPINYTDKAQFIDLIKNFEMSANSLNFQEAISSVHKAINKPKINDSLKNVINIASKNVLNTNSNPFWILASALNLFIKNEGLGFLPVLSDIPDIITDSVTYSHLKKIYKEQSLIDAKIIISYVKDILVSINLPENTIPEEEVVYFVKNCRSLAVVQSNPISNEYENKDFDIVNCFDDDKEQSNDDILNPNNVHWYLSLRSVEIFYIKNDRFPCSNDDILSLRKISNKLYKEYKIEYNKMPIECLEEIYRYKSKELHTISSFIGGVASQICLKLATKQYIPFNNTFLFNGIFGSASQWTF